MFEIEHRFCAVPKKTEAQNQYPRKNIGLPRNLLLSTYFCRFSVAICGIIYVKKTSNG